MSSALKRMSTATAVGASVLALLASPANADDTCAEPERTPIADENTVVFGPTDGRVSYQSDGSDDGHVAVWGSRGWVEVKAEEGDAQVAGSTGRNGVVEPVGGSADTTPDACSSTGSATGGD